MAEVRVYSKESCPYCVQAKQLLSALQADFTEIRVDLDEQQLLEMMRLSGRRTVPQIFINGQSIGGCDALFALHNAGKLQALLV
jgi:glutaredoxin 3